MAKFVISTCSTFDLTKEHADSRDISVIYFHYSKNGERLDDDMFQSVTPAEFYGSMVAGADMKTSQINTGEFLEYFGKFLKDGKDVIHFSLSSGISGVYSAAETAAFLAGE
jgi:fatty acid-binding protein DegV